jgi:small subunit ribosomal protein S20
MANIKSQIKRNRQNEKARMRNKSVRSEMRTAIRKLEEAAAAGESTQDLLRAAQSKIDVAVSKGVLKKTAAARKKSRLAARVSTDQG